MKPKEQIISDLDTIIKESKLNKPSYHRIIYFAKQAKWMVLYYETLFNHKWSIDFKSFILGLLAMLVVMMFAIR